jgi:hypothetical protein
MITAGILGTLADVNGDDTNLASTIDIPGIPLAPQAPTPPTASSPGAPAPPTGLRVLAAPPATLAAIPSDRPAGYYVSGGIRGYYINVNSPYWVTNQSYGDFAYKRTTNSLAMNPPEIGTNHNGTSKNVTATR